MASITIRKLPETTKRRLRIRAAQNGHSMEQEARDLLEAELARTEAGPEDLSVGAKLKVSPRRRTVRELRIR